MIIIIIIIIIVIILLLSLQFTNQIILFSDFCEFSASSHHLILIFVFRYHNLKKKIFLLVLHFTNFS